jgi:tetratricopeptide (TPR) repeat protein
MHTAKIAGRTVWSLVCIGLLLAALSGSFAYGQNRNTPHSKDEAWKLLQDSLKHGSFSPTCCTLIVNSRMEDGVVTGTDKTGSVRLTIHLADVTEIRYDNKAILNTCRESHVTWSEFPYSQQRPGPDPGIAIFGNNAFSCSAVVRSESFLAALTYLAHAAQQEQTAKDAADLEAFKTKAAAWRQLTVKPAMPTEAHEHQVLAEYAYKNKDLPKAIIEYEEALTIFPYWPDGQSNLANLAAEVGTRPGYRIAVDHMQMYLDLVPDAPDAQAAQDSIIIWKSKLGEIH